MDIHKIIFHIFTPPHGPPHVISQTIKQKFDESLPSWKKVGLEVHDMWFGEFKGSRIYKNAMNKIRNGHDRATWILPNFQNKRSIAKANRAINKGVLTYYGGSISTSVHYEKMWAT
ncbi:hypothetical protein CR513_39115, partial [Mucuna pruriens]